MGGFIYFLSLEEPSQPLTFVLWGLREVQRAIAASPVSHGLWDRLGTDSAQGQAWGGREETLFLRGNGKKGDFLGEAAPAWALCSYLYIYLANFGQKRDSGGHILGAQIGHRRHLPSLLAVLHGTSFHMDFPLPKACQPALGAGDPGDRHPETLLTLRCPQHLLHVSHVLCQAGALPV